MHESGNNYLHNQRIERHKKIKRPESHGTKIRSKTRVNTRNFSSLERAENFKALEINCWACFAFAWQAIEYMSYSVADVLQHLTLLTTPYASTKALFAMIKSQQPAYKMKFKLEIKFRVCCLQRQVQEFNFQKMHELIKKMQCTVSRFG